MDDPTTSGAPQTPESTGLPADLFAKAQAAATEKGRPIYVYRAERAGRFTSKWEPVDGATPAAVIEPRPAAPAPPAPPDDAEAAAGLAAAAPDADRARPDAAPDAAPRAGDRLTLYAAGGQTVAWEGVTELGVEDGGQAVRFRDRDGALVRLVVGGGSLSIVTPQG